MYKLEPVLIKYEFVEYVVGPTLSTIVSADSFQTVVGNIHTYFIDDKSVRERDVKFFNEFKPVLNKSNVSWSIKDSSGNIIANQSPFLRSLEEKYYD